MHVTWPFIFLLVLGLVGFIAAAMTCWLALHKWQDRILRRERGEEPPGFPVKVSDGSQTEIRLDAMGNENATFDPEEVLTAHAEHLNQIRDPDPSASVFYELMSGALIWSDERDAAPIELVSALRPISAYRTGLIIGKPRAELEPRWQHALSLFPQWIGFRPERRQPTTELLAIYRRGRARVRQCLRTLDKLS